MEDLAGYPIDLRDIEPYYDAITSKVGLAGRRRSVAVFRTTLDCNRRSSRSQRSRRGAALHAAARGTATGCMSPARMAVLAFTTDAALTDASRSFRPNDPAVYNPTYTLDEMVREERSNTGGLLVESYAGTNDGVAVRARCLTQTHAFTCRRSFSPQAH